ncbi:helix-turn-helix transcriptional regulator [Solibacillus silvestris]
MTQVTQQLSLLKQYRKENHLVQERMAEIIGVTQGTYSRIENGIDIPSFDLAKRISQITGIQIGELWERYKL